MADMISDDKRPKIGDANFEALRPDKTKLPQPTKREYEINAFNTAIKMMRDFRYRPWMSNPDVIGRGGKRINENGEVYTPKFRRKA